MFNVVTCLRFFQLSRSMVQMSSRSQIFLRNSLPICGCRIDSYKKFSSASTPKPRGILVKSYNNIARKLRIFGILSIRKSIMKVSSIRLLMCITEQVDYEEFFKEFNLVDSFNSWFRITELHIWLLVARLRKEGDEGNYMRHVTLTNMWTDVIERSKKLGGAVSSSRKEGIDNLHKQFYLGMLTYDEGLLDSDKVLAACIWRQFFEMQCDNEEHIELLVHYVRKQVHHLDSLPREMLLRNGLVTWLPLKHQDMDKQKTQDILNNICKRMT